MANDQFVPTPDQLGLIGDKMTEAASKLLGEKCEQIGKQVFDHQNRLQVGLHEAQKQVDKYMGRISHLNSLLEQAKTGQLEPLQEFLRTGKYPEGV